VFTFRTRENQPRAGEGSPSAVNKLRRSRWGVPMGPRVDIDVKEDASRVRPATAETGFLNCLT